MGIRVTRLVRAGMFRRATREDRCRCNGVCPSGVDVEALRASGLLKGPAEEVKILGEGAISRPLTVRAHAFSLSARKKIEGAGGKAEVI